VKRLELILQVAAGVKSLKGTSKITWRVELEFVGRPQMAELNFNYRKKNYATDVLSFSAPDLFKKQGLLGELVLCLPVLKAQAKTLKTSSQNELDVLLVHGVLHLLGFDHEKGVKEAALMARWESRILKQLAAKTNSSRMGLGLIERSNSGKGFV
jgi:rRNA maturation RNase YbeY